MKHKSWLLMLCVAATFATASAQESAPITPPTPPRSTPVVDEIQTLRTEVEALKRAIADKGNAADEHIKQTETRLTFYAQIFLWTIGLFGIFIAIFGAAPVFAAMRSSIAADRRASEAHTLAIRGEKASQDRAAEIHSTFLGSSKDTLTLVNETLTLAKEASERAANLIQRRANELLKDLDSKSRTMANVAYNDDRALVTIPEKRSHLTSLASKIHGFDNNRFILPVDIELTPSCQFIRGLDFHLKQQFDDAFEVWDAVTKSDDAPNQLKSLAWYWIGYENNNLGYFTEAEDNFKHAEALEVGPRRFELQRIRIESRFFNTTAGLAQRSIAPIESLLDNVSRDGSDQVSTHKTSVLRTYGNILLQAGREESDQAKQQELFKRAEAVFGKISTEEKKWATFGLGQALWYQGKTKAAEEYLRSSRRMAQKEDVDRIEPRTKVLARTTELICCVLVEDFESEASAVYGSLINALGMVEDRLTVYSQIQKRNVKKELFAKDLTEFAEETKYRGKWLK